MSSPLDKIFVVDSADISKVNYKSVNELIADSTEFITVQCAGATLASYNVEQYVDFNNPNIVSGGIAWTGGITSSFAVSVPGVYRITFNTIIKPFTTAPNTPLNFDIYLINTTTNTIFTRSITNYYNPLTQIIASSQTHYVGFDLFVNLVTANQYSVKCKVQADSDPLSAINLQNSQGNLTVLLIKA